MIFEWYMNFFLKKLKTNMTSNKSVFKIAKLDDIREGAHKLNRTSNY